MTTCFSPKRPRPGNTYIQTKTRHWVLDGLYINEISFAQLISLGIERLYTPQLLQEDKGNIMKNTLS
jgi:hypothetical protein